MAHIIINPSLSATIAYILFFNPSKFAEVSAILEPANSTQTDYSLSIDFTPLLSISLPPSLPLSLSPSLPPSLSPSFPHSLSPSLPPSLSLTLPPPLPPSLPPSFPPSLTPPSSNYCYSVRRLSVNLKATRWTSPTLPW